MWTVTLSPSAESYTYVLVTEILENAKREVKITLVPPLKDNQY
jgi:hypothetical protein